MSDFVKLGKFLALVLRHQPEVIGLKLDKNGWVGVDDLVEAMNAHGKHIDHVTLDSIVSSDNKGRYEYGDDHTKIRACQGHSVKDVDLELQPKEPPDVLYHGTATRFVDAIRVEGLKPGSRLFVHLSWDVPTALKVGARHGSPQVLVIETGKMHKDGHEFFLSNNSVWLTKSVPPKYIR